MRLISALVARRLAEVLEVDLRELVTASEGAGDVPEGAAPRSPAVSGITSRCLHRAYFKYLLTREVGTAYSALSEGELMRYCKGLSWEGVLEVISAKRRELQFLERALEDPRLPTEVRLFFEEVFREAPDQDLRVLAAARGRERSGKGREELTRAMRRLL